MTPAWVLRDLEQLDIIHCIGKYFLIEKMAFPLCLTFAFTMHKFPERTFSLSVPRNSSDYYNILIIMNKDAAQP